MKFPKIKSLYAVLPRLAKRERFVLYAAATFIFLALFDRLLIYPIFNKMKSLKKEIQETESSIRRNLHILAQKDRILSESAKYASFIGGTKSDEEEMTFLLKEVEGLANKSSVYLIDIKPAGTKGPAFPKKCTITLNCEAQMEQLISFIYSIENFNRLLIIEKYQITPKVRESSVAKCVMSVSKISL